MSPADHAHSDDTHTTMASPSPLIASLLSEYSTRVTIVSPGETVDVEIQAEMVFADDVLQNTRDYRGAIQNWFAAVAPDGYLVIAVPHIIPSDQRAEDVQDAWGYTPGILAERIEEALAPASYRLRHLLHDDHGSSPKRERVIAVLQKLTPSIRSPDRQEEIDTPSPDDLFPVPRTRIETAAGGANARILLLKLDHLGDFVMAIPAIERVRMLFPTARISLVVGSWNVRMATDLGIADEVIAFDAFPRNSGEEVADVHGRKALFELAVTGRFDIAIDLRTDPDTRFLLASVNAGLRAGLGVASEFPFLDIFLPVDFTRRGHESSIDEVLDHHRFPSEPICLRNDYRISFNGLRRSAQNILVWGPYLRLRRGRYTVVPRLEITTMPRNGLLTLEVTLDDRVAVQEAVTSAQVPALRFTVVRDDAILEMRLRTDRRHHAPAFNFYGARLMREGSGDLLHQSEYLLLLVELVGIRIGRNGLLREIVDAAA